MTRFDWCGLRGWEVSERGEFSWAAVLGEKRWWRVRGQGFFVMCHGCLRFYVTVWACGCIGEFTVSSHCQAISSVRTPLVAASLWFYGIGGCVVAVLAVTTSRGVGVVANNSTQRGGDREEADLGETVTPTREFS